MNSKAKKSIAIACLLLLIVCVFAACKSKDDNLVSVSTDENGSLYYTDPTTEVDGITYGGETHYVNPDETNSKGEYKINDKNTSAPVTTGINGGTEGSTTQPEGTTGGQSEGTTLTTTTPTTAEKTSLAVVTGNGVTNDGVIAAW